jgi:hypothetical protein
MNGARRAGDDLKPYPDLAAGDCNSEVIFVATLPWPRMAEQSSTEPFLCPLASNAGATLLQHPASEK